MSVMRCGGYLNEKTRCQTPNIANVIHLSKGIGSFFADPGATTIHVTPPIDFDRAGVFRSLRLNKD